MSAKKTVRHIQNNFRLTTKLLSDSNILPVSKVLLKNNFPTYELPLHNPNSRPKKKKTNIDCPPCPPVERDCPEPEKYSGQTSYLNPRSRLYPSSKLNPRSKLYPRSKWEPKKKKINEYFEKLENETDISDDEKDYILSEQDYQEEYEKQEVELGFDPKKAALLADFFSKIESGQLSKPKDNQEYSQTKKYSFGNPRKSSQSKRHIPTFKSSDIFRQQELEESAYIDDDGNYIPEKKNFNSLAEYKSECEYVDKKSLFKQMDEQFHQSNEEELTYRLFQHQFEYHSLFNLSKYQGMFATKDNPNKSIRTERDKYLDGYEYVSEYNTNIKYKEIGADLLPKKDNAYYRLYTNCKNFIVERFYKIGSTENKNEFTHPLPIDKYFEIINPVDKASSNATENQSYSIAFDLGKKSAIAKLPQDHKRDPKWNQLLKEVADRIRDQRINKPLHEVLPVLIKNWNDGWINQKNELDRVAGKVYDKVVKDKYEKKEKVPTDKSISFDKFDTIEFADLIRKNILTQNSKIDNRRINSFFESTYINLKSEKFIKEIQESFELALVKHCRQIFFEKIIDLKYEKRKEVANELHKKIFDRILEVYNNQPVLNVRTSTSVQNQAYSTPIPLGYLISFYLGLYEQQNRSVFEPCAGNGSLLIAAHLDNVTANELDPIRVKHLESHGFRVEPGNALDYIPNRKFARIVMNPPFGVYPANKHIKINGKAITQIDQAIAINSLQYLEPNGIAAIILGGHTLTKDPRGGFKSTDQFFHNHLYRNYDILKCVDINGDLYRKQGTSFDIRLIILRNSNTPEYKHILPYQYGDGDKPGQVLKANTWEDLFNFLSPENISKSATTHEINKPKKESFYFGDVVAYDDTDFAYVMDLVDFDSDGHYDSLIVSKSKGFNHYDFIKIDRNHAKLVYKYSDLTNPAFKNVYKELHELYLVHKYSETVFHVGDMIEYYFDLESAWGFVYQSTYDENKKENFELITRYGGKFEKVTRYDRPNKIKDITSLSKSEKEAYLEGLKAFSEYNKNKITKESIEESKKVNQEIEEEDRAIYHARSKAKPILSKLVPPSQKYFTKKDDWFMHIQPRLLDIVSKIPKLGTTDINGDSIAYLHIFASPEVDLYILEASEQEVLLIGSVISDGEFETGYYDLDEIWKHLKDIPSRNILFNLDFHFDPKKLKEINDSRNEFYKENISQQKNKQSESYSSTGRETFYVGDEVNFFLNDPVRRQYTGLIFDLLPEEKALIKILKSNMNWNNWNDVIIIPIQDLSTNRKFMTIDKDKQAEFYKKLSKYKAFIAMSKGENNEGRDERDQENSSNANRESGRMVSEWNEQGSDQGHRGYSGVTGSSRSGTQDRYDDGESGHSERNSKELTKERKGTSGNSSLSQRDGMPGESNNAYIQSDISNNDFEFDPKKAAMMAAFFEKMNIS